MVGLLRYLLQQADAVIVCGGLGPTQDDITREAIAEVMGTSLERRDDLADAIRELFLSLGRPMPANNLRQADVPKGGEAIPNPKGTAPGLLCPVGDKVIYAVPGVPHEMQHMVGAAVVPHLLEKSGERGTILSRSLKTWGSSESGLSERIANRVDTQTNPTIAFLARGIEGLIVRITAKARDARGSRGSHRGGRADPAGRARRSRLRRRRRDDGVGGERPAPAEGLDSRPGRVSDRRSRRLPHLRSPGVERDLQRIDRLLRHRGEAVGARGDSRARGQRGVRRCRWPRAPGGCWAPTSAWR